MVLYSNTYALGKISAIAKDLLGVIKLPNVLVFEGDLGAGKTTLIKELCKQLGVMDTVSSPTFSLVNTYLLSSDIAEGSFVHHIDLYRLSSEAEAMDAGVDEILNSRKTCFVEWPSRVPGLIPPGAIVVTIENEGDGLRKIEVSQSKID